MVSSQFLLVLSSVVKGARHLRGFCFLVPPAMRPTVICCSLRFEILGRAEGWFRPSFFFVQKMPAQGSN
jgi:hypothetical protein